MKPLNSNTAGQIAVAIPGILRDRADREDPRDLGMHTYVRYVEMLRTGKAWRVDANTVVASVSGPDADIWGQVAADAIDSATQDYDLPRSHIHDNGNGHYTFKLVCDCGGACTLPAE